MINISNGTIIIIHVSFLMWMTVASVLPCDLDLAELLETPSATILQASFKGHLTFRWTMLSTRVSCWPKTRVLMNLSATLIIYIVSTLSMVSQTNFSLYHTLREMNYYANFSLNLKPFKMPTFLLMFLIQQMSVIYLKIMQWKSSFFMNNFFL
jgi:hypothetical protein